MLEVFTLTSCDAVGSRPRGTENEYDGDGGRKVGHDLMRVGGGGGAGGAGGGDGGDGAGGVSGLSKNGIGDGDDKLIIKHWKMRKQPTSI